MPERVKTQITIKFSKPMESPCASFLLTVLEVKWARFQYFEFYTYRSTTRKARNVFKIDFNAMSFPSKSWFSEVLRTTDIIWYNVKSNTSYQQNNYCLLGKKGYAWPYSVHLNVRCCLAFKVPYN